MTEGLTQRARYAHEALAVRIAQRHWPPDTTPPDVFASAVHTLYISLMNGKTATMPARASRSSAPGSSNDEAPVPPPCPICQGPMRDQRATKRGNQPDWKCVRRECDGAVWLDRKVREGR